MLTKSYTLRLKKICKVLFGQKYKYVSIDRIRNTVTFSHTRLPIISLFVPKWKLSLTELINYQIPNQLADFKYGNNTFIGVIQEDMVACQITKKDVIDYFWEEIVKIKFATLYQELNVQPLPEHFCKATSTEEDVYRELLNMREELPAPISKPRRFSLVQLISQIDREMVFYLFLLVIVFISIVY